MPNKKQPAKKRAYKKRKNILPKSKKQADVTLANFQVLPVAAPKKDNELKELLQVISIFDNWNADQRSRNLKYIVSRYFDFM